MVNKAPDFTKSPTPAQDFLFWTIGVYFGVDRSMVVNKLPEADFRAKVGHPEVVHVIDLVDGLLVGCDRNFEDVVAESMEYCGGGKRGRLFWEIVEGKVPVAGHCWLCLLKDRNKTGDHDHPVRMFAI